MNGSFTLSEDGTSLTYACNVGYVLVGENTRDCRNDGTGWTEIDPNCCKKIN